MTDSGSIVNVDPKLLTIALNPRKDAKLNPDFLANIKELGVLQPPTVIANDTGGYDVIIGQRRTLAAVQAGFKTIPVYLVAGREGAAAQMVDQMAENEQRQELSNAERVGGYKSMSLFGMTVDEIAKKNRVTPKLVESALAVAASEKVTAIVEEHEIDLEQAAAIVEFEDDKKTAVILTDAARTGPSNFAYKLTEARKNRKRNAQKKDLQEKLRADRIKTVKGADYAPYDNSGVGARLEKLTTPAGKPISMTAHKKCPGHAAFVDAPAYTATATIIYVCTDWAANGHTRQTFGGGTLTPEQIAERAAEVTAKEADAHDRDIVRQLRTDFIINLLQTNKPALAADADVDRLMAIAFAGSVARWMGSYQTLEWVTHTLAFLQVTPEQSNWDSLERLAALVDEKPREQRAIAIATALGRIEWSVRHGYADLATATYFETLARWGHTLTERELTVIDQVKASVAKAKAERETAAAADAEASK